MGKITDKLEAAQATIEETKVAQKTEKTKKTNLLFNKVNMWEIFAYILRGAGTAVPMIVIIALDDAWVKSSIGFGVLCICIALLIIYKEPIKKFSGMAPGIIPFAIMFFIAVFFKTTAENLFIVSSSGLISCGLSIPLHYKYVTAKKEQENEKSDAVLNALKQLSENLSKNV